MNPMTSSIWWISICVVPFVAAFLQPLEVYNRCRIGNESVIRRSFTPNTILYSTHEEDDDIHNLLDVGTDSGHVTDSHGRRHSLQRLASASFWLLSSSFLRVPVETSYAATTTDEPKGNNKRSRTVGYSIQKTDEEWRTALTSRQYQILRQGGTERQFSSVLEDEERDGTYYCAGCGTALFSSVEKFHSGTGWPSFASSIEDGVEVENVNVVQAKLGGAELRCKTCGGHLGDVFQDGWIFTGTRAAETGKRFCIDGSALIFRPSDGSGEVAGDKTPPNWEQRLFM